MYLDWKARSAYVIDIETDDLEATKIWVMCWKHIQSGDKGECVTLDQIRSFFDRTSGSIYIGHNILKFDAPVLNRIAGSSIGVANCIDTLVLSTLYSPSRPGGHSVEAIVTGKQIGRAHV